MSAAISIARVNNRQPLLAVGLSWDSGFNNQTALNAAVLNQTLNADDLDAAASNPFYVTPPQHQGTVFDMQLIAVAVAGNQVVGHVDGDELEALDGVLAHTGDDKTGADGGWDEMVNVALNGFSPDVTHVGLFVHSRSGQPLARVPGLKAAVFSLRDNAALVEAAVNGAGPTTLFAVFVRQGDDFVLQPVQKPVTVGQLADVPNVLSQIQ